MVSTIALDCPKLNWGQDPFCWWARQRADLARLDGTTTELTRVNHCPAGPEGTANDPVAFTCPRRKHARSRPRPDARRREGQRGEGLAAADGADATLPQELGPTTADNGEQVALFTGAVPRTGGDR